MNKKTWIEETFKTKKAVIGLVHMQALPGDPYYDAEGGMDKVIKMAQEDVIALQEGGADGLLFTNEFSLPYISKVGYETVAAMSYVMGNLKDIIKIPYGNDCINDETATIAMSSATGACFTRGVFHGSWSTNGGIVEGDGGNIRRICRALDIPDFKLVYYLMPESSGDLAERDAVTLFKSTYTLDKPDAIAIAGVVAGQKPKVEDIKNCREKYPDATIFAATGVNKDNVDQFLPYVDGMFIGTSFKKDGIFKNQIDKARVKEFMEKIKNIRKNYE